MTAFARVVDALTAAGQAPKVHGRQAAARCPAHDDRRASLSLTDGAGRALLHCHAGCDPRDVVAALGLRMGDLFDEPPKRPAAGPRRGARRGLSDRQLAMENMIAPLVGKEIPGGCEHCDAVQTVHRMAPAVWRIDVHHDRPCPWFQRYLDRSGRAP